MMNYENVNVNVTKTFNSDTTNTIIRIQINFKTKNLRKLTAPSVCCKAIVALRTE